MTDAATEYAQRHEMYLTVIAAELEQLITSYVCDVPFIERVTARAKDPDRFAAKATRTDDAGNQKYEAPLTEIQDQVGARVIVVYPGAVDQVSRTLWRYFQSVENQDLVPESHWEFGYFGRHHVFPLPADVIPAGVPTHNAPRFFELQIKTLFQHAWSEAEHDLGYKSAASLTGDQQRSLAFAAAQAWGADKAFDELQKQLRPTTDRSD